MNSFVRSQIIIDIKILEECIEIMYCLQFDQVAFKMKTVDTEAFPTSYFKQKTLNYITITDLRLLTGDSDVPNTGTVEIASLLR